MNTESEYSDAEIDTLTDTSISREVAFPNSSLPERIMSIERQMEDVLTRGDMLYIIRELKKTINPDLSRAAKKFQSEFYKPLVDEKTTRFIYDDLIDHMSYTQCESVTGLTRAEKEKVASQYSVRVRENPLSFVRVRELPLDLPEETNWRSLGCYLGQYGASFRDTYGKHPGEFFLRN